MASAELTPSEVVEGVANLVAEVACLGERRRHWTCATACSTRRGPTRSKSSTRAASANGSRAAMPNITAICSSGPKPNGRRGPRPNGWPIMGAEIDNLRAALDWAFSPGGDTSIGVALTAAAVPLWMHLSLMEECRGRVERALAAIRTGASGDLRARDEAPCRACRLADVYQRRRSRDRRCLDNGSRDCGAP